MTTPPLAWLTEHAHLLPQSGRALDVACGHGRNALWLGARGLDVLGVDRSGDAVQSVNDTARRLALPVRAELFDLESGSPDLGQHLYEVVVVANYLHRALFPALLAALRPGGLLVYETFIRAQASRGMPRNPAFLLDEGELRRLVAPLAIVSDREGDFDGRWVASVVARK